MAKVIIIDDEGGQMESDTFAVVTLEQEGEVVYARCFTSLQHLGLSQHLIAASALSEALTTTLKETTGNSGVDLLFEHTEFSEPRIETDEEEGDDEEGDVH